MHNEDKQNFASDNLFLQMKYWFFWKQHAMQNPTRKLRVLFKHTSNTGFHAFAGGSFFFSIVILSEK